MMFCNSGVLFFVMIGLSGASPYERRPLSGVRLASRRPGVLLVNGYRRSYSSSYRIAQAAIPQGKCGSPPLENGRVRVRQRSHLAKFLCDYSYELVGNKYATCRDGSWDVPLPVCVRSGCPRIKPILNGINVLSHHDSWAMFFCNPGFELSGSQVLYCNGHTWNDTVPSCIGSEKHSELSCSFEESELCGWKQDELHDFDWRRINKQTPSAFLNTGPTYDHTLGPNGQGYYMYVESSGETENRTARLLSPVYSQQMTDNSCFSFYYHMYGRSMGGLRVYQKPESYPLLTMLELEKRELAKYLLFEKWGNQGNLWYRAVTNLRHSSENFQIVIEGVRGYSVMSDIAVDDVALLQGPDCVVPEIATTTEVSESCYGRCWKVPVGDECSCDQACMAEHNCCVDFFGACVFEDGGNSSSDEASEPDQPKAYSKALAPQTMKLVAPTLSVEHTTPSTTTTPRATTPRQTTPIKLTTSTTTKTIATTLKTTTAKTLSKTTKVAPTTRKITFKPTEPHPFNATGIIKPKDAETVHSNKVAKTVNSTTKVPTNWKSTNVTTGNVATRPTTEIVFTTKKTTPNPNAAGISRTFENHNTYHEMLRRMEKAKDDMKNEKMPVKKPAPSGWSVSWTLVTLACALVAGGLVVLARSTRCRDALIRVRVRRAYADSAAPDVHFLTGEGDEEID